MKSSERLLAFYKAWLRGADESGYVRRDDGGLCFNLYRYAEKVTEKEPHLDYTGFCLSLIDEMRCQFSGAGMDYLLPFNDYFCSYTDESINGACSSNPKRRQWVLDRIADTEE